MEDHEILELLAQRSDRAIGALSERFGGLLYHIAMNLLGDTQDAEECVNDTLLAVWNSVPPNHPLPLQPYICRIGRNIALNRLRRNTTQKRAGYEISLDELAGCISAPLQEDSRLLGQAMNAWLSTLNKENRAIFLRRYWFGDSVKDIAAATGLKENAVSVRLGRLREKLKGYLYKEGYYE
jgi:RNA polymerase sigma-70 factor (ECF subfamily)